MPDSERGGVSTTFRARTAKEVLCRISRDLGPGAVILAHRKVRDAQSGLWVEATAITDGLSAGPAAGRLEKSAAQRVVQRVLLPSLGFAVLAFIGTSAIKALNGAKTAGPVLPAKVSAAVLPFENDTGDPAFDLLAKVISNLLITRLDQSGFLDVASWERMQDLLEQRENSEEGEGAPADLAGAIETCRRHRIESLVTGSFAKSGDVFVTDAKVLNVKDKTIRASASSQGTGEESVLRSQIDELGREILEGFGFFGGGTDGDRVQRIADITTDSMDAYYHYLRGRDAYSNENLKEARVFLEKAVQIDPQFATAGFYLATTLSLSGERRAAIETCKIALSLADRATEKERLFVRGMGSMLINGDYEEAGRIFTVMARQFPNEKDAHVGLGIAQVTKGAALRNTIGSRAAYESGIKELERALELDPYDSKALGIIAIAYTDLREYEKAVEHYRQQIAASPGNGLARSHLAAVLQDMGRLEEAAAACDEAFEADPDVRITVRMATVYALAEDYDKALRLMDGNAQVERYNLFQKGVLSYLAGNLAQAESDVRRLTEYALERKSRQSEANALWVAGWLALDRGEFDRARSSFAGWFDIYAEEILPKKNNAEAVIKQWRAWLDFYVGLTDVREGDLAAASARLAEIDSELPGILPDARTWAAYQRKLLAAEIALAEGDARRAVAIAEASPLATKNTDPAHLWLRSAPFLSDVLARAYHQSGDLDRAIAEYERLIAVNKRGAEYYLIHPVNYFRLARLYEEKGEIAEAVRLYERLLELWKHAEAGRPEVAETSWRLARLKGGS
ncbi:MAG: tetratricopeptide repeat protein [Candidatus Aminicenantes bacterium]|nr:tetratricopeptide repeat protein [Candidatus Aminicenantes bacterium]